MPLDQPSASAYLPRWRSDFPTTSAIAQHIADSAGSNFEDADQEAASEAAWDGEEGQEEDFFDTDAPLILDTAASTSDLLRTTTLNLQSIVADITGQTIDDTQPVAEARLYTH